MIEKQRYPDFYEEAARQYRMAAITQEMASIDRVAQDSGARQIIPSAPHHQARRIVEVGPGNGGVNAYLRNLHPNAHLVGVDIDTRASQGSLDELLFRDIRALSAQEHQEIFGKTDFVFAMRTSAEIAAILLRILDQCGFDGSLIFSYIRETDMQWFSREIALILEEVQKGNLIGTTLHEGRDYTEKAYVRDFSKK